MTAKTNENKILDMLTAMQAEIAELKSGTGRTSPKVVKTEKPKLVISTAKTVTMSTIQKALGDFKPGMCPSTVFPKVRTYEHGSELEIHHCGQKSAGDNQPCKYHASKNDVARLTAWQNIHSTYFPAWEKVRKGDDNA